MISGSRPRVVIADDHPQILETTRGLLASRFDVVAAVGSGEDAIAATARLDPDLVLLDIAMKGLDGFQTASAISARGSSARIAFMSGHDGDDYVLEGLARGASAFIPKPRMLQDLVPALEYAQAGHTCVPRAGILPRWHRRAGASHDLQLYTSDDYLLDALDHFFGAALEAGHSLVAVATPAHLRGLEARLRARQIDVAALTAGGRYSPVDVNAAIEAVTVNGHADEARFISTFDPIVEMARTGSGRPGHVSVFGEIAPQLCARRQQETAVAIERICATYAASRPISVLCGYSTGALRMCGGSATPLCAEHAAIVPPETYS